MRFLTAILLITHILLLMTTASYAGEATIVNNNVIIKKQVESWAEIRDEDVVKQKYDYSCGTASIATILRYYFNEDVTEKEILEFLLKKLDRELKSKEDIQQSDFAFSFRDLQMYAESKGYKAIGLAMPLESLMKLKVPAILYVETRGYEHFTVFRGVDERFVYLADPSFGNLKVRIERFKSSFYTREDLRFPGKGLVLIPESNQKKKMARKDFMKTGTDSGLVEKVIRNRTIQNTIR